MNDRQQLMQYLSGVIIGMNELISFQESLGYPIFGIEVDAPGAYAAWLQAHNCLKGFNWSPVLISSQTELAKMAESKPPAETIPRLKQLKSGHSRERLWKLEGKDLGSLSTTDALSFAQDLNFQSWIDLKVETDDLSKFMEFTIWNEAEELDGDTETIISLNVYDDTENSSDVLLLFLPVRNSYCMPALFGFGGWHDCPPPQVQVCLLKHWNELYGAEMIGLAHNKLDLWVGEPVVTRAAAVNVSKDLFVYCPDLVHQGDGTLSRVAAQIFGSKIWPFWWD